MRISDWSSDVCSSDLHEAAAFLEWYRKQNNVTGALKVAVFSSEASPAYVDIAKGLRKYADENKATIDLVEIVYTEVQPTDLTTQVNRVLNKRSEEHTSELQSLMRISYAVFCLKKKIQKYQHTRRRNTDSHAKTQ